MQKIFLLIILIITFSVSKSQIIIKDVFGRNLSGQTIRLVDWEGYMANPAILLTIQAPADAGFPITVNLSANGARLYFNNPSTAGSTGPTKSIIISNTNPVSFYISIFPDRAGGDETYALTLQSSLGQQMYPILVFDQDSPASSIDFNIILDYSRDNPTYNFFSNQSFKNIVRQAADDWAFFISNMNFDQVVANSEQTFIFGDNFQTGNWLSNQDAYTGFLLYPHGFHSDAHRSGGSPSTNAFQKIGSITTQLRRSGSYDAEVHGNFNTLGWNTTISDNTWYLATNFGNVPNDYYSLVLHELGHAISFNPGYPQFQTYKNQGFINDANVVAYHRAIVPIDASDHLSNGQTADILKLTDRISKKGAYGSEYASFMPNGRWLISKLNLLCLKSIGYNIKPSSAFVDVSILTPNTLPEAIANQMYNTDIVAQGSIPFYKFEIVEGSLPNGLILDSFTGNISGTPAVSGSRNFTIKVTDYDNQVFSKRFSLNVLGTLPVILSNFKVSEELNCVKKITFSTSAELNIQKFEVQKSNDSRKFLPIANISSKGIPSTYQYEDKDCKSGISYYRLKSIDKDSSFSFSKIVSVVHDMGSLYVSKIGNSLKILGCDSKSNVQIRLSDFNGKTIYNQQAMTDSYGELIQPMPKLPAGIYLTTVRNIQKIKTLKIIIQ